MLIDNIAELLEASDAVLLQHIGDAHSLRSLQARPRTDDEREESGKDWISAHINTLRKLVCSSLLIQAYLNSSRTQDRVMLAAAIADLISSVITGIAAVAVAVLILREGIASFCGVLNEK